MKRIEAAQTRMAQFPKHLMTSCRNQATRYAKCMAQLDPVKKGACEQEFQALKDCIRLVAKKGK